MVFFLLLYFRKKYIEEWSVSLWSKKVYEWMLPKEILDICSSSAEKRYCITEAIPEVKDKTWLVWVNEAPAGRFWGKEGKLRGSAKTKTRTK